MASPRYCDACALRVESGRLVGLRLESRKGREDRFASLGLDVSRSGREPQPETGPGGVGRRIRAAKALTFGEPAFAYNVDIRLSSGRRGRKAKSVASKFRPCVARPFARTHL
jgi:hypothetical protein